MVQRSQLVASAAEVNSSSMDAFTKKLIRRLQLLEVSRLIVASKIGASGVLIQIRRLLMRNKFFLSNCITFL
jgi:hypothetical protein